MRYQITQEDVMGTITIKGETPDVLAETVGVVGNITTALRKHDPEATAVVTETRDHHYIDGGKTAHIETVVNGVKQGIRLSLTRKNVGSKWSHTYAHHLVIETNLDGRLRNMQWLKAGGFNYDRLAEGLYLKARREIANQQATERKQGNAGQHKELIDAINAVDSYTARASSSEDRPIHISYRIDTDMTPERAQIVLEFIQRLASA